MRQYQPIWEHLKKHKTASIVAPINSHRRITQAVRKEKCKDAGWRLLESEKGFKYELKSYSVCSRDADSGSLNFHLVDISAITINNL